MYISFFNFKIRGPNSLAYKAPTILFRKWITYFLSKTVMLSIILKKRIGFKTSYNSKELLSLNNCIVICKVLLSSIYITGVFTPSDDLAEEVFGASEVSGEKFWRLPLEDSYWESMKSGVADMVNTGGRQGGAITAALFLKQVTHLHCQRHVIL